MVGLIFRFVFCDLMRVALMKSPRLVSPCPISDLHSGDRLRTPAQYVLIGDAVELSWSWRKSSKINIKMDVVWDL